MVANLQLDTNGFSIHPFPKDLKFPHKPSTEKVAVDVQRATYIFDNALLRHLKTYVLFCFIVKDRCPPESSRSD